MYARELARRYPEITSVSIHPGVVQTGLVTNLNFVKRSFVSLANMLMGVSFLTPAEGCYNQVWASAAAKKSELDNGAIYYPVGKMSNSDLDSDATDQALATKLWDYTNEELAKY